MNASYRTRLISNREQISYARINVDELARSTAGLEEMLDLHRAANSLQDALNHIDRALAEGR